MDLPLKKFRLLIVLASLALCMNQMPEWKFFRDREGNVYFIDQAGKMRITDTPAYRYRPVTARGIDYYLQYGMTLINEHRMPEGLSVLKSILALPVDNNRVYAAQARASDLINNLKKRHGPRFNEVNIASSLILTRRDSTITVANELMRYGFLSPAPLEVVRKRDRVGIKTRYSGILFGIGGPGAKPGGPYEFLCAVDCEQFSLPLATLSQATEKWGENLGHDDLAREELERSDVKLINEFTYRGNPSYSGIEGFFINGDYSYCVRLLTSEAGYARNRSAMKNLMASFRPVSQEGAP